MLSWAASFTLESNLWEKKVTCELKTWENGVNLKKYIDNCK